ncbi:MAG: hypothetical protein ACM30I_01570 [Gemmatimonas sp.]
MSTFTDHHPIAIANDNQGSSAFIVESGDVPAGIIVREGRSFRFFSAHHDFRTLDGQYYATPRAAQSAVDRIRAANDRKVADARPSLWSVLTL